VQGVLAGREQGREILHRLIVTLPVLCGELMVTPLTHLDPGASGRIVWIAGDEATREMLAQRGVVADAVITFRYRTPVLKLQAYGILDSVFFLSRKNAGEIFVEEQ
jgi:Fe2+ transport system protein FeoA